MKSVNEKGEYALYDQGQLIGYTKVVLIDGAIVPVEHEALIRLMKSDAKKDGIDLTIAVFIRIIDKQIQSRKNNVIKTPQVLELQKDAVKYNDFIMNASPGLFKPETGKPGFSKHQKGTAADWNVTKLDEDGKKTGMLPSYAWLIKNAFKYGFVRTIPSEEWHFEIGRGANTMYDFVPATHKSWNQ